MIGRLWLIIIVSAAAADILSLIIKDFSSGFLQFHYVAVGIIIVILIRNYLRSLNHGLVKIIGVFNFLTGIVITVKVLVFHIFAHYQSAMVSWDLRCGILIVVVLSLRWFIMPFLVNLEVRIEGSPDTLESFSLGLPLVVENRIFALISRHSETDSFVWRKTL
jgi:hypothetical protein